MKQIEELAKRNREVNAAMWEMDSMLQACGAAVTACVENGVKEPDWGGVFSALTRLNRSITEQVESIGIDLGTMQREGGLK